MTWYEILSLVSSLIGMPTIILTICKYVFKRLKEAEAKNEEIRRKHNEEYEALKEGVQAMLRAQMINEYNKALDKGYAAVHTKEAFENVYNKYHTLGVNGVMDGIHIEFMEMPSRKEDIHHDKD